MLEGTVVDLQYRANEKRRLIWAVLKGDPDTVRLLLERGADINARDNKGVSALFHSFICHHTDVQTLLLFGGAHTDVFYAACLGDIARMQAHLAQRADPNARDGDNTPLLVWAVMSGSTPAVRVLLESGADVNAAKIAKCLVCRATEVARHS
jgi:ankyrin repeat protein